MLAILSASPAHADQVDRWHVFIDEAAARCAVPADWIRRVMRAESAGLTMLDGRPITSRAGALGLMQLMPGTWTEMRGALGLGADPYNPRDNILAGACYLRLMYDRFSYPGLFAAYNAGPARYAVHLATGRVLPGETRAYLALVSGAESRPAARSVIQPMSSLFFQIRRRAKTSAPSASEDRDGVFVALAQPGADRSTP